MGKLPTLNFDIINTAMKAKADIETVMKIWSLKYNMRVYVSAGTYVKEGKFIQEEQAIVIVLGIL